MKLRLPLFLQAALLSALAGISLSTQATAETSSSSTGLNDAVLLAAYTNPDILYENKADPYIKMAVSDRQFMINNTDSVQFKNNTGQIIVNTFSPQYSTTVDFQNNGTVLFEGNRYNTVDKKNGACICLDMRSDASLSLNFKGNEAIKFTENKASGNGGAIYFANSEGSPIIESTTDGLNFIGNRAISFDGNEAAIGGAIYTFRTTVFDGNDSISITGNKSTRGVAGIYVANRLSFTNNTNGVNISGNINTGAVSGALYAANGLTISGNGLIEIKNNSNAGMGGGAIYVQKMLDISNNDLVTINGNTSKADSGAIFIDGFGASGTSRLSADKADIVFSNNISEALGRLALIAKYQPLTPGDMEFRATEGNSVRFYDAFRFIRNSVDCTAETSFALELNKPAGYTGRILISGMGEDGISSAVTSSVDGNVNLYHGKLEITDKAKLLINETDSLQENGMFTAAGGTELEMTKEAHLAAANKVVIQGNTILTAGSGASLATGTLDISNGLSFNLSPFLDSKDSGLKVTADNWLLNGDITLTSLDFEGGDTRWEKDQKFLLLSDETSTRNGEDFYHIFVEGYGDSSIIESGSSFKGQWSSFWEGDKLYAVWSTTIREKGELWWDGEGSGDGNGVGIWNQNSTNTVWNKDASDGEDWEFEDLDVVHFWKGGDVQIQGRVTVQGHVKPLGVVDVRFNSDKGVLTWWGNGSLSGNGTSLEKRGTGSLIIKTDNSYKGGTSLYGGTIQVETLTGLGSGLVTIHGGYLNLGTEGVANKIDVVGQGAISGRSEGAVTVKEEGQLTLLSGKTYTAGLGSMDILNKGIQVNDQGSVKIQAGAIVNAGVRLDNENTTLNFVSGNGKTSVLTGVIEGSGTIHVQSGSHQIKDEYQIKDYQFDGDVLISGGDLTVSSQIEFGDVNMTGGAFIADNIISFDSLTVGSAENNTGSKQEALLKMDNYIANRKISITTGDVNILNHAILNTQGIINAIGETHIQAGGALAFGKHSTYISSGKVLSESADATSPEGRITMGTGSTWNANGGFELTYLDARQGTLTIGSDSILKANGFIASEKDIYGTDKDGRILPSFAPEEFLPELTIFEGATIWTGTTTKSYKDGQDDYRTLTGFYNVKLNIAELATIGTFVIKGTGDGIMNHAGLVLSMHKAFTTDSENDQRNYVYILKNGVIYNSEGLTITSRESIHVDSGAIATVNSTSGAIFNDGGTLTVNQINDTGTVTISGGKSDLTKATSSANPLHMIGSFGDKSTVETAAEIKINESGSLPAVLVLDSVQAQTAEKTVIVDSMQIEAQNFVISGADTILENRGGALVVEKEVTLADTATYKVGNKDRFGWINMDNGNVDLTASSWSGITLGSYAASTDETAARIRLNEQENNTVEANELHVVTGNEETLVNAGTTIGANKLIVDQGSHLKVNGGEVNVHVLLNYGVGAVQEGLIHLTQGGGVNPPAGITVNFSGNNHVGHIDSSAATGAFVHRGFNQMDGYTSAGRDTWTFVLTDDMLDTQNESNALSKIAEQSGNALSGIKLDTSKLTKSYTGDIQLYSDNITLTAETVDYGEATGTYNQKDAVKNFHYVNPLIPDVGDITVNSLWSMASAMDAFSSAVMGQLDLAPYRHTLGRHIWMKGLYMNENIGKALPGYRKDSGGYIVGADTMLNEKSMFGVSFGQTIGTETTYRRMVEDDQKIMMYSVYGRHLLKTDAKSAWALDFMGAYGRGYHDATFYKNETSSHSGWTSDICNMELKLSWNRKLSDRMSITPYVGSEYIFAEHKAHTASGAAGDFDISRSRLSLLRLPVGAMVDYKTTSRITNYLGASYVPDVLRRNPSATVTNGMETQRAADSTVGRHALRAYAGCTWQMGKSWLLDANYELNVASRKVTQTANLTASYSF